MRDHKGWTDRGRKRSRTPHDQRVRARVRGPAVLWLAATASACAGTSTARDSGYADQTVLASDAPSGCGAGCDDGIDCTDDTCANSMCVHTPVPARCAAGSSCDVRMGCRMGRPCAGQSDCADTDPCTTNERCDSASRTCVFDPLDGDRDGIPPRVCGGGDCDDSSANVKPGASELCNGIDDNCNGAVDEPGARGNDDCPGRTCVAGRCTGSCLSGFTLCGDSCRDLNRDEGACGACGARCLTGMCVAGRCTCARPSDTLCPRAANPMTLECVDTAIDTAHCGNCGRACSQGQDCVSGTCQCRAGYTACPGRSGCFDLQSDFGNCGQCGRACPSGTGMRSCTAGRCVCRYTRPEDGRMVPGLACESGCVDPSSDPSNCGSCGTICAANQTCVAGACVSCPASQVRCGNVCVDVTTDRLNCGRCGAECPRLPNGTTVSCAASTCQCPDGMALCPALGAAPAHCAALSYNPSDCGACNVACPSIAGTRGECVAGLCEFYPCPIPAVACGGRMVCTFLDPRNCGGCGRACAAGQICDGGVCR